MKKIEQLKKDTQNYKVYEWLKEHGSINTVEAAYALSIFRLSARINELRTDYGVQIKTVPNPKSAVPTYVLEG